MFNKSFSLHLAQRFASVIEVTQYLLISCLEKYEFVKENKYIVQEHFQFTANKGYKFFISMFIDKNLQVEISQYLTYNPCNVLPVTPVTSLGCI